MIKRPGVMMATARPPVVEPGTATSPALNSRAFANTVRISQSNSTWGMDGMIGNTQDVIGGETPAQVHRIFAAEHGVVNLDDDSEHLSPKNH